MPHVVNGCGTWYYGKKNLEQHPGTCSSCGRSTTLTSYDTRLWVVFVMVPIIPLAAKRIIEQCGSCKRHRVMPLKDWRVASSRAREAMVAYRAKPKDAELAIDVMKSCVAFRNAELFLEISPEIERNLADDSKVLCSLASVHDLFGRILEAERLFRAALAVKDEDDIREALAQILIRQNKPTEAQPLLAHIVEKVVPDRVNTLYQLAQAYQRLGQHDQAIEVFNQCEQVNPHILDDKVFARLRDTSVERAGTNVPINPGSFAKKVRNWGMWKSRGKFAAVAIPVLLVLYLLVAFLEGQWRKVYLVNGLAATYTVKINGTSHTLMPHSVTPLRIPLGDVHVEIAGAPPGIGGETATLVEQFITRPFSSNVFVINPDRAALLLHSKIFYGKNYGGNGPAPIEHFYTGDVVQKFDDVDYPFTEAPREISMDSSAHEVAKVALSQLGQRAGVDDSTLLMALTDQIDRDKLLRAVQHRFLLEPVNPEYMSILLKLMTPQQLVEFTRPLLDQQPTQINWHRAYQTAMDYTSHFEQVEKEYTDRLRRDPKNPELLYLASRVIRNPARSLELLNTALSAEKPTPYAYYSMCGLLLNNGEFHNAAHYGELAVDEFKDDISVKWYCIRSLIADGQYMRAREFLRPLTHSPWAREALEEDLYMSAMENDLSRVDGNLTDLKHYFRNEAEWDRIAAPKYRAEVAYARGMTLQFGNELRTLGNRAEHFAANITDGDVDLAEDDLQKADKYADAHLLLYLVASRRGRSGMAERHLHQAIEILQQGSYEERAFAAALSGHPTVPTADLIQAREETTSKPVLLTALGNFDPAAKAECFAMARKLNVDHRFPYLLIKSFVDGN